MKNKKITMYILIVLFILIIGVFGYVFINKNKEQKIIEYIPQEEISNEQMRETTIDLYFYNPDNDNISLEIRKIDAKKLLNNPAEQIINLLIDGPNNNKYQKLIPDGTKLNKTEIKDGVLNIDFSEQFINSENGKEKLIINSILNTLIQLNEINAIKISINGDEEAAFINGSINFKEPFFKTII